MGNTLTADAFISKISGYLRVNYTDEQREMIKNINHSMFVYADPGTGKTATVTAGLVFAELYEKIPGSQIVAISFTNAATNEMEHRYKRTCEKLDGMKPTVQFSTLHKICRRLLEENCQLLGISSLTKCSKYDYDRVYSLLTSSAMELGIELRDNQVFKVYNAIQQANNSLVFSQSGLESRMFFREANIPYEDFMMLRKVMYDFNRIAEVIQVSDILLYTLELLTKFPKVAEKYKEEHKLMIVDESQDMSLLQLQIISLLAEKVVFIGDMKQQIYGFNGACAEVGYYFKVFYPDAKILNLSQSFRCDDEIVEFAKPLILPNEVGGELFKGTGPGGRVNISPDFDINRIAEKIKEDKFSDVMILYRNNYSSVPVIDTLYKAGISVRCRKHVEAYNIPVIHDLVELVELARNPSDYARYSCLRYIIPEFSRYGKTEFNPIAKIASKNMLSLFDIGEYKFHDPRSGNYALMILQTVREMLLSGEKLGNIFNELWPMYNEYWVPTHEFMWDYKAEYYTRLVAPLIKGKTYDQFVAIEQDKAKKIIEANQNLTGVRCSTFHAAKGLEADVVYLLDVDAQTVPNKKQFERMVKTGAVVDAARAINNERSLLFVAATRARHELTISYDSSIGLSNLISEPKSYTEFDLIYKSYKQNYDDMRIFERFCDTKVTDFRAMLEEVNRIERAAMYVGSTSDWTNLE